MNNLYFIIGLGIMFLYTISHFILGFLRYKRHGVICNECYLKKMANMGKAGKKSSEKLRKDLVGLFRPPPSPPRH